MEGFIVLVLLVGGVVFGTKLHTKRQLALGEHRSAARVLHLRSGNYPASCSWCKGTTLARKLLMFERSPPTWRATDVMDRLQRCAESDVIGLSEALQHDHPMWRRLCSERCAKELFATEHVGLVDPFVSCEYCSVRSPATLVSCPNCGAARRGD